MIIANEPAGQRCKAGEAAALPSSAKVLCRRKKSRVIERHVYKQPRSQGLSSLPPLVVGRKTLVAAGHVIIRPFKTAGWVGTQANLVEGTIEYHPGEGEVEHCWFQNGA